MDTLHNQQPEKAHRELRGHVLLGSDFLGGLDPGPRSPSDSKTAWRGPRRASLAGLVSRRVLLKQLHVLSAHSRPEGLQEAEAPETPFMCLKASMQPLPTPFPTLNICSPRKLKRRKWARRPEFLYLARTSSGQKPQVNCSRFWKCPPWNGENHTCPF